MKWKNTDIHGLKSIIAEELNRPVAEEISQMAAAIAKQHPSARGILFYGSALRATNLDGLMLDFYLIVDDYKQAYRKRWLIWANECLPPNVFLFRYKNLVAKYAVLSVADFRKLVSLKTLSVSVWARFAQPTRLVWCADAAASNTVTALVACAAPTLLETAAPLFSGDADPLARWREAFRLTYQAELRVEKSNGRADLIVDSNPEYYRRMTQAVVAHISRNLPTRKQALRLWAKRRRLGKWLSILRLMKASFTFSGGLDYLAWKINRHAGTKIIIKSWQRRFPLIGALTLLPKLLVKGTVR
ncbi:hypothetical protein [Zymomonas mobilis]|nr:hypothetical protein [Zymomonas mobilis]MDX5948253.1 hypothetical protein [Zymomonas mobilis subsp. pomaceae]